MRSALLKGAGAANPQDSASVTGPPPQLGDDNDATGMSITGYYYADGTQIYGYGYNGFEAADTPLSDSATFTVLLRYTGAAYHPRAYLRRGGYGLIMTPAQRVAPPVSGYTTAWTMTGDAAATIKGLWPGAIGPTQVQVIAASDVPNIDATLTWFIQEVALLVTYPTTDAPPRRLFPREDGLGVGGVRRHWPPSKSVQRGIRRAGGYL